MWEVLVCPVLSFSVRVIVTVGLGGDVTPIPLSERVCVVQEMMIEQHSLSNSASGRVGQHVSLLPLVEMVV